jgi:molybdopterin-containing oxidoreductase family membrane subunit
MAEQASLESPVWNRPLPDDPELAAQVREIREKHLLQDARPPREVAEKVLGPMARLGRVFWLALIVLGGLTATWLATWAYQAYQGMGVTGLNRTIMWAPYIVNFVYFIGIGHAGTFISAALRVLKFEWRAPISRAAESLTVFALLVAFTMPLIHMGRVWKFYWMLPFPNQRQLWPNPRSPIFWDMTAIFTYLTCSMLFMYLGILPDIAIAREKASGWRKRLYTVLALGWRGTDREWKHLDTTLNVFSYGIIPVMFSVHTVVSWDFAMTLQPGWNSSIFGPYFVVGALYSGVGAVIIIMAILRKALHLEYFLREEHFNAMGKFLLILSFTWVYFYFNDYLLPWYHKEPILTVIFRLFTSGWAAPLWFTMLIANILIPWATLWSRKVRSSIPALVGVALLVQVGMYIERYLIVAVTLGYPELPFDWAVYVPRLPEILITLGVFAFVVLGITVLSRLVPIIPIWEVVEGQLLQGTRRIGRAIFPAKTEAD